MICACKNWNGDCRYNSSRMHTRSCSAGAARATDMEIILYEDFDFTDGAAENSSPITPWIKKISKILKRIKYKVSTFSGTTESLLLKSIEHLEDLDKSNNTEKSPSVCKQIFIGIMLLIKIILASI